MSVSVPSTLVEELSETPGNGSAFAQLLYLPIWMSVVRNQRHDDSIVAILVLNVLPIKALAQYMLLASGMVRLTNRQDLETLAHLRHHESTRSQVAARSPDPHL